MRQKIYRQFYREILITPLYHKESALGGCSFLACDRQPYLSAAV